MNKKLVAKHIDFADSEFDTFELTKDNKLIVYFISWDEKILKVYFFNPIQFSYKLGYHISNIYEVIVKNPFLDEALSRQYVNMPNEHPFKLYQIEDLNDFPFIQVIAEDVKVIKE